MPNRPRRPSPASARLRCAIIAPAFIAAGLACIAPSAAGAPPIVISGGGSVSTAGGSGGVTASLTLGQPVIGVAAAAPVSAKLGFWYAVGGGCPADFNGSGGPPTVQDIFDYLAAYFANDPRADFNGVGGISVQDIFDYLAAYLAPC